MNFIEPIVRLRSPEAVDPGYTCAARRAVITGMGVVAPNVRTTAALASFALEARRAFAPIERFPTAWCATDLAYAFDPRSDAEFGDGSFKRAWMDRATWYLLDALDAALHDAGVDLSRYDPTRIAVVLGSSHAGLVTTEHLYEAFRTGALEETDRRRILAIPASHVSAAVAAAIGSKGIRRTVSIACASSTGAMGMALDLIRGDKADLVVTGGTDTVSLAVLAGFNALQALATDGCTPFSGEPGITLGEGAAVFVVERMDRAHERASARNSETAALGERETKGRFCHAEILGYALSGDAHHATAPDAEGDGIQRVLRAALDDAAVEALDIDYLSAHGTGTDANDLAESRACLAVFGENVPLSSAKSIFGHTLGACGALETALTLTLADQGRLSPTLGFAAPREHCAALDYIPSDSREASVGTFVCNNYGFGGVNASVVLRRIPEREAPHVVSSPRSGVVLTGIGRVSGSTCPDSDPLAADGPPSRLRRVEGDVLPASLRRSFGRASPMVRFAIAAGGAALKQAGVDEGDAVGTGLVYGVVTGAQRSTEKYMESVCDHGPGFASAQHFPHTTNNAPCGAVSLCFGLKGYNATMCGSPGALGYAFDIVSDHRQERLLVAAADEWSPILERFYRHIGCTDESGTAPFAEGAVALVLESEMSAERRGREVLARVLAVCDAQDATFTGVSRRGNALTRVVRQTLLQTGITEGELGCIVTQEGGPERLAVAIGSAIAAALPGAGTSVPLVRVPLGIAPAHATLALLAEAVDRLHDRPILVAAIDLTGCAFAVLLAPPEGAS